MKKQLTILATSLCLAMSASAEINVKTVDMKKVFESYKKTKDAEQRIGEMRNKHKIELENRMEKLKAMKETLDKLSDEAKKPELAQEKRQEKARKVQELATEANALWQDIQKSKDEKEKQLADHSVRMRNSIVEEIKKVLEKKIAADSPRINLILDSSGQSLNGVSVVLHSETNWDITKDVVDELNKAPGASSAADIVPDSAAPPAPAPKKDEKK